MRRLARSGIALCLLLIFATAQSAGDTSLRGTLLVAAEDMAPSPFARTVVLIIEHGSDGALGLVLNRRTELTLADVLPGDIEAEGPRDYPLHTGGPVRQQQLGLLVRADEFPEGVERVLPRIGYTARASLFDSLLADTPDASDVRIFAGHAGWAPQQLEAEIERGDWHIVPATAEDIFSAPGESLWRRLIERIDGGDGDLRSI